MSDCCGISCFVLCGFISSETLSTRQKWSVRINSLRRVEVLQSGCSSACVETFSTLDAAKFPINIKNLFISKSWQIACPWRLQQVSSTDVLIHVDVISNKQSIFSSQIRTPSFSINWSSLVSLVSTTRSPIILWRLWSHKLRTNTIPINISPKHL